MKLGIYGGTFNPPHLGHLAAAQAALEALALDALWLIPAATPPHKPMPPGSPRAQDRLAMVELAADGLLQPERVSVSDMELRRSGKSYTADTLQAIHARHPDAELWLLTGSDMFFSLQNWWEPEVITRLAGICAFARAQSDDMDALAAQAAYLEGTYGARTRIIDLPHLVDVSSTQLRALLAQGGGEKYLPPAVYGYILRNGLYGVRRDLKRLSDSELRCCSYSMIRAKRIAHVGGVEEEAVRLARRWGADPEKARRAGILHDCTKYLDLDEQLQICRKYGIVLDHMERASAKLLHAKTGAWIAREVYGADEDVFQAIFWHTTGKADMRLLEKVVYLADYIEPNRDFPGLAELRRLAYEDLDRALLLGVEMSIADLTERGVPIHPNTQAARDYLARQSGRQGGSPAG